MRVLFPLVAMLLLDRSCVIIGKFLKYDVPQHEELNNFEHNKVWRLVPRPTRNHNVIGTKWIFKNMQDSHGIIVRNKVRLVAQGYSQVKGIDYSETFAPVARLESIRLLIAYASHHNFKLQQMDVKIAFLNCPINELVYVIRLQRIYNS